jgi:hydrogenase maturation protease
MTNKKTLILGIGNNILTDDGIGSRLVSDLIKLINDPEVHYETACCGGLEIVEYIRDYERVIFIDSIRTHKGRPGDVYYFIPSDFRETSHLSSLHDVSFLTALNLGHTLNLGLPDDLHIIAVEIIENMEFSEELTLQLKKKYTKILQKVLEIVRLIIVQKEVPKELRK